MRILISIIWLLDNTYDKKGFFIFPNFCTYESLIWGSKSREFNLYTKKTNR